MLILLLHSFFTTVSATPSAFACPFTLMGPRLPMDPMGGEVCGRRSFLHYYACCEDNLFQCCFYFETWAIVMFAIVGSFLVIGAIACAIRAAMNA